MAVELVTGYAGQSHVGADEARKVIRSLAGKGNYWCEAAPTLSMTDSNTFHTAAFYAVCGGGVFRIEATDLTVDNGAQGVKRNDFVCVEYDKDTSTGIESAQLVVVKGTPGTTATDPTLTTGDLVSGCTKAQFALARIALDGITVGTPVLLLDRLPTLDSVSQAWGTIGRVFADVWTDRGSWLMRCDGIVTCHLDMIYRQSTGASGETYFSVPSGFRPASDVFVGGLSCWESAYPAMLTFKSDGGVAVTAAGGGRVTCDCSWPVAG